MGYQQSRPDSRSERRRVEPGVGGGLDEYWRTWAIENLGTVTGACCADAHGINNGSAADPNTVAVVGSSEGHAVVWTKSATGWVIQDLGTSPGDMFSFAEDVNDHGAIVGMSRSKTGVTSGFLWTAPPECSGCPVWAAKPGRWRSTTAAMWPDSVRTLPGIVMRSAGDPPLTGQLKISERSARQMTAARLRR